MLHIAASLHHNQRFVLPYFAALKPLANMWLFIHCVCHATIPMVSTKRRQSAVAVFPHETRLSLYPTQGADAILKAALTPERA